ncbi:MAG: hypothetical protein C4334_12500 [Pyrinomonas sp.]
MKRRTAHARSEKRLEKPVGRARIEKPPRFDARTASFCLRSRVKLRSFKWRELFAVYPKAR